MKLNGKLLVGVAALFLMAALSACAGSGNVVDPHAVTPECVWPDMPERSAPLWVCDAPVEGVAVSAVGSTPKSAAGPGYMKTIAAAQGRAELARQIKVHVQDMVKQFVKTTGAGETETVDALHAVIDKQVTDQYVTQSRIFRSMTSPAGTMYVLVGMDSQIAENVSKQMLKTSFKNDQALWQEFQAKKGFDELAEEIVKEK